jgi:hypothetical protein
MVVNRRDGVTVPRIWVTVALSVLIHVLVLWLSPQKVRSPSSDADKLSKSQGELSVQLAPRPQPRPSRRSAVPPAPRQALRPPPPPPPPPKAAVRPQPKPPVLALNEPAPAAPPAPKKAERSIPAPATPRPPADGDLASYIESRRRAREPAPIPPAPESVASAPSSEDPNARANRIAAANLGTDRKPAFGPDQRRGGGVFQVQRMAYDYAEFAFYGWNKDIRRNTQQLIEVRRGTNSDIRIAVVRRMIAIIREHEQGDFVWESPRLGRNVNLSARQRDNGGLEDFLMLEFFEDDHRPIGSR